MQRPTEFDTLISKKLFENVPALLGAAEVLMQSAREHLKAHELLARAGLPTAAFGAAYDGLSQLFQAMFEYYEVRAVGDLRNAGTYVLAKSLDMHPAEQCMLSRMHDRRQRLSAECPYPQPTRDDSQALAKLLEKYLPIVYSIVTNKLETDHSKEN
jgi:hypothetical protein